MDQQAITPHFEFGYGLSYTTFSYSALSIATSGTSRVVTFIVKNTGTVAGTEIPQLYLSFPASAGEPKMVLRGFDDIDLAAGASASVSMTISQREMRSGLASSFPLGSANPSSSIWNVPSQSWIQPTGTFTVSVGASIKDIRLTGTF